MAGSRPLMVLVVRAVTSGPSFGTKPTGMVTPKERRKFRREFRRKGYWGVYHEVNGYPQGKRELAHEWLRERERASDHRERWMLAFIFVAVALGAGMVLYLAAVDHGWL